MDLPKNIINSQALLIALDRQSESLPESLQQSLTQIGRDWQTNPTEENAKILRQLIKGNESLEAAYMSAVVELRRVYTSQERTKSSAATLPIETRLDDYLSALFSSENWVETAKQTKRSIENFTHSPEQLVGGKPTENSIFGKVLSTFQGWADVAAEKIVPYVDTDGNIKPEIEQQLLMIRDRRQHDDQTISADEVKRRLGLA